MGSQKNNQTERTKKERTHNNVGKIYPDNLTPAVLIRPD